MNNIFQKKNSLNIVFRISKSLALVASMILAGCGGGGGSLTCVEAPVRTFTQAQVASMTANEVKSITDVELQSIGTNIKYFTNDALAALQDGVSNTNIMCVPHKAQIYSITPDQIASLTPAQVNHIGSAETGIPKIDALSQDTFTRLASDRQQVSAFTIAEVGSLKSDKFLLIGSNFNALSDSVLTSLKVGFNANTNNTQGQIYAITPNQIASLPPERVRLIGSFDNGISKIAFLNPITFAKLVSDPVQAAAITNAEIGTMTSSTFALIGNNFSALSDSVLASLQVGFVSTPTNTRGQIYSITPSQISLLTPAQVRILGSFDDGISKINFLSSNTFKQLASYSNQVMQITPTEITTLYSDRIANLGTNIRYLSDASLGSLNYQCVISVPNPMCQVESLTYEQVSSLSPSQIAILANKDGGKGISYLDAKAFGALSGPQVASWNPGNVALIKPEQLAAMTESALISLQPTTTGSFTPWQKSLLSPTQHTACGC